MPIRSLLLGSLSTLVMLNLALRPGSARMHADLIETSPCKSAMPTSLRPIADCAGILLGTAVRAAQLGEPAYAATLAREYNLIEPEDALKWEVLHPERHSFDFSDADRIVAFAKLYGMKIRGHTLVWTHQNPPWLVNGKFSETELRSLLHEHISEVVGHYRGQIYAWDVVNESIDETGNLRSSLW